MNRKKNSKLKIKAVAEVAPLSRFDDPLNWIRGDFSTPPWTPEQIQKFQDKIDSAFCAKNAFVLAWSADRKYGDEFVNNKGELERKPVLLFGEFKVNDNDYVYITAPRWVILEVHHGSQLEASWEESSYAKDEYGNPVRIRAEKPPEFLYVHSKLIAQHETSIVKNGVPPCCLRMWQQNKRICYGKYREPAESDLAYLRDMREKMDKDGVAQRNDAPRSKKLLEKAGLATKHFMRQAEIARAKSTKEFMLANADTFFGDIVTRRGATMSPAELEKTVRAALDADEEQRFA